MSEPDLSEEGLSLLLETSRDFAFKQLAEGLPLMPFATCVKGDGDMNFVRFAEPGTDLSPEEAVALTEKEVADEVKRGGLAAFAIVSGVRLAKPQDGMEDAVRIHVESAGFARQVLAFYAFEPGTNGSGDTLSPGKIVPFEAEPVAFTGE
ncbi:hypothetical protein [Aurantiacibacter poecillastricola]|uniref:hypothetical protein n=1 Tax=Aurantiacibacter poecillastricola TaxID=3064385 RepID=UPI00273E8336|nr:hypothetical protein [Aurantiacibacter sp. 219JJ12-13]MDP5262481.1 hypothetical protein [Aurantiacibacter sp. 219JJ12-13]